MNNQYLCPLFWQHGEDEAILREEIRQMHRNGIGQFVVEARPHPDYLQENWWEDLKIIVDEAKRRNMSVWLFDDGDYPSGFANGKIKEHYPQYTKKYLMEVHIDAVGPLEGSTILVEPWLEKDETLVKVIVAKRTDGHDRIDAQTLTDLTDRIVDGRIYWNIPDGFWRIFILKCTPYGEEAHTMNHLNPLEEQAVKAFIDLVYEKHYEHFPEEFGKTIKGFFTDEPRFGNAPTYYGRIGRYPMRVPYSHSLLKHLYTDELGDFSLYWPCLWYDAGDVTADVRYTYMNAVSKLFSQNYTQQIGKWCEEHQVKLIGHVVEENGAHARLGYGAGHYFRAMQGMHAAGLDIVYNIMPEYTEGSYNTPFFNCDCDFSHWGIAKMASSASHIDPAKNGVTMCEAFGAYGWQEGLKLMKWITDNICVRGGNFIIPHAFSPKDFPDEDCPPHFYARGANPQWKYFHIWSNYANRVCKILTSGVHRAPAAVVYHAEAEWGGDCEPFEKVVKVLMQNQIDCDVIPIEQLGDAEGEVMKVNQEEYQAVIVPYCENIPEVLAQKLLALSDNGVKVIFMTDLPKRLYYNKTADFSVLEVCKYQDLAQALQNICDIRTTEKVPTLRYYHYSKNDKEIYFFVNESSRKCVNTKIVFKNTKSAVLYDPMRDQKYDAQQKREGEVSVIDLELSPFESIFVIFGETAEKKRFSLQKSKVLIEISGTWKISVAEETEYPHFKKLDYSHLGNISVPDILPDFAGTIRYEISFILPRVKKKMVLDLGNVYELAKVSINNIEIGTCICPPYIFDIPEHVLKEGENMLVVEVTNTLSKKYYHNVYDRAMPQEPSGLLGKVRILE